MSTDYKSCTNLATGKTSFDLIGPKYARSRHRKRFRPNFLVTCHVGDPYKSPAIGYVKFPAML